jgi:glycosyltransferase involved in cell wall biosynthesis
MASAYAWSDSAASSSRSASGARMRSAEAGSAVSASAHAPVSRAVIVARWTSMVSANALGEENNCYIRRAARVVAASDAAAGWLRERYALGEPVAVVRNTVGALPATSRPAPRLRELIGLMGRADGRIIVHTGPVTRGDGLPAAVEALRSLPDDVLAVVGLTDPAQVRWLRRRMSRSGVTDRVRFVHASRPERVIELAAQADFAFVGLEPTCLAHRLALPGELFVAIQAGLPVAASDLPDIAAVLDRYNCGLTFRPGDPADVVRALSSLRADEALRHAGVALAAAELSWDRERYRLLETYTALAGLSHLQHQRDRSVVD